MLTPLVGGDATQSSSKDNPTATRPDEVRAMMNTTPRLEGMHAATATTTGWIEAANDAGPECFFCGDPARRYKPLNEGSLTSLRKLWWCRPCETTWVA